MTAADLGLKIVSAAEFAAATDVTEYVRTVAGMVMKEWRGMQHICYMPNSDRLQFLVLTPTREEMDREVALIVAEAAPKPAPDLFDIDDEDDWGSPIPATEG